jgi:hypothetical protein
MRVPSPTASRGDNIICPFCASGLLVSRGPGFARCDSCGLPLLGSALETLREIVDLPDALGVHACECDHPSRRSGRPQATRSAGAPRGASTASTSAPLSACPGTAVTLRVRARTFFCADARFLRW